MKAVYFESDWPEEFGVDVLVTWVREDEQESDAILRAQESYGPEKEYFVREAGGHD
jgi:hypothetical protein